MKKLLLKSNTEGLLLAKENTGKEVLHEEIFSEDFQWDVRYYSFSINHSTY